MKSIQTEITSEIIINKSRFITILTNINDIDKVKEKLEEIKKKYKDATHYCYAYIINNHEKCSDNGEPSGTAGMPILNVLKQNDLTNILCVVIRYFGGIKLGAGGLIRAYSTSASVALNKATITNIVNGYNITIEFSYNNLKQIDYLLKNIDIKTDYQTNITYNFNITETKFNQIENELTKLSKIKLKKQITLAS
ncbi:putative uncharacterized protein [Firmicutes bacterium CAG:822]|nr:putative uncharacterized protein [Firmicutes bacterium CAG:822]